MVQRPPVEVAEVFRRAPPKARARMNALRDLVLETAAELKLGSAKPPSQRAGHIFHREGGANDARSGARCVWNGASYLMRVQFRAGAGRHESRYASR